MESQSSFSDEESTQSEEEVGYDETEMNIDQQEDDEFPFHRILWFLYQSGDNLRLS